MTSSYPTSLDTLATNKTNATVMTTDHPGHHNDIADAINKLEAKLGVGSSTAITNSLFAASATGVSGWTGTPTLDGSLFANLTSGPIFRAGLFSTSGASSFQGAKSRGTEAAPRRVKANDLLMRVSAVGSYAADDVTNASLYGGTNARMEMYATEDFTATAQGSEIAFTTIVPGSTTASERLRISSTAVTLADAGNIVLGTTTGTKIGTATTQKLGFWNATPVAQPAVYTVSGATADRNYTKTVFNPLNEGSVITYDANSTSIDELADALGTLMNKFNELQDVVMTFIADVKSTGLVG